MHSTTDHLAFGAPGIEPRWTSSAKDGLGTELVPDGAAIEFTFFWKEAQRWEGRNFSVAVGEPQ